MAKCEELQRGDRVRMTQGKWKGEEGEVLASCKMAAKSKFNPNPRANLVWVRFDNPRIREQYDIYDYELEKVSTGNPRA